MPFGSGGGGGTFNGGTITNPLVIDYSGSGNDVPLKILASFAAQNVDFLSVVSKDAGTPTLMKLDANVGLHVQDPTNASQAVIATDAQGGELILKNTTGVTKVTMDPTNLQAYGGAGANQQTISGAKLPSDVVLADLLTALAAIGLIVDSTT